MAVPSFLKLALITTAVAAALATACCADDPEIRAFWADAFHTGYRTAAQVDQLVADVRNANMNTIIVQVRRRGDVYYNSSKEPWAADSGGPAFDALGYLCAKAHTGSPRLNVYAWFAIGPIWNSEFGTPASTKHPYRAHPEFLTRDDTGVTFDGSNYQIDLGHPGSAQYHHELCMEVVNGYDVDGIHLDRIRFDGKHWGYNPESVARFNLAFDRTGQPAYNDAAWLQWRRDQITAFVRRLYLDAISVKPSLVMSAATNTRAPGITDVSQWPTSAAYSDTLQDWRAWTEEGIIDLVMPMTYMNEQTHADTFERWTQFTKDYHYNRHAAPGLGAYMNSVADTIKQIRRLRQPSPTGNHVQGLGLYSYAVTNDEVPEVPRSMFIQALTVAPNAYDPSPIAVFPTPVPVPPMPWKVSPTTGHLAGIVTRVDTGDALEAASVVISGPTARSVSTDSNGFYGTVDLAPGAYSVTASMPGYKPKVSAVSLSSGAVSDLNFALAPDADPPVISNVTVSNLDSTSATIEWDTQIPATSRVEYGPTSNYWHRTVIDPALVLHHSVKVAALIPGMVIHFRCVSSSSTGTGVSPDATFSTPGIFSSEIIIDNTEATQTGAWITANTAAGRYPEPPADYEYISQKAAESATATWRPNLPLSGLYSVYTWYGAGTNRSTASKFYIDHSAGTLPLTVNQQTGGGSWRLLASSVDFNSGTSGCVRLSNGNPVDPAGLVIADAVRFLYTGTQPDSRIALVKLKNASAPVNLLPKTVAASFASHFYIQELDGSSAIRVDFANSFVPGDVVQVRGTVVHTSTETKIAAASATKLASNPIPPPVRMASDELGGIVDQGFVPALSPGTGICTTALLATVTGRVTHTEGADFWLDDGLNINSQGYAGVRVQGASVLPSEGAFVTVTGVVVPVGTEGQSTAGLRVRSSADIVTH